MLKQKLMDKMVNPMVVDNRKSDVPWQSHSKPLYECKIALVTTAGVHMKDQEPFDVEAKEGDASLRRIPLNASESDYQISHTHYDHAEADKDINCVFPIDVLHTLKNEGLIAHISEVSFGFMGFILQTLHPKLKENARQVAQELLEENVDIVLMTPGWPLCHQSLGLIQRELEEAGLTTVSITVMEGITSKVKPPRAVYVPFPLGQVTGKAFDKVTHKEVVKESLKALEVMKKPGEIKKLPFKWE